MTSAALLALEQHRRTQVETRLLAAFVEFGIGRQEILGRRRTAPICAARHWVWQSLHELGWSSVMIGRAFGRDHSTVLAQIKRLG